MKKAKRKLTWGTIGLGKIAHHFIKDFQLLDNTKVGAVASRNLEKAKAFADEYQVPASYGSYEALLEDESVDIVYIATPHHAHAEWSIKAMNAGKHVLCEKPLAVNQLQVENIIAAARRNKVFMMEAFWSRFNPTIKKVLSLINEKAIGKVNYVNADFSFFTMAFPESRILNMELAGGALLDVGVYPLFLAYSIFGKPEEILATARFHKTGADVQTAILLKYENGIANLMSGISSHSDMVAKIYGTKGQIYIDSRWHEAQGYTIVKNGISEQISLPTLGRGFTYEIQECITCIQNRQIESALWTHQNSLDLIEIADKIRNQIGLKYPFE